MHTYYMNLWAGENSRIYSNDNCVKIVIYAMITDIFTKSYVVDDDDDDEEEEEKVKRLSW